MTSVDGVTDGDGGGNPPTAMEEDDDKPVDAMDWVKVEGLEQGTQAFPAPATQSQQACPDEYSFGTSDGDDSSTEDLDLLASVSLDSSFDLSLLRDSISLSTNALDDVEGRDVVMVVGKTGVGKSTAIQGLAGKKLERSFHRSSFHGQMATKPVFDVSGDALPEFAIGHAKKSQTRSLSAHRNGSLVYVDSPGLEDTKGAELDIATSSLLSQVAKRCNSIRFVVLIHCASLIEDRGKAFRSLLQFSRTFVTSFEESRKSFMFLFTHTDEMTGMATAKDAKSRLLQEIIQIASSTDKKEEVIAVLDFVRKSLKRDYPFAGVLHPISTDFVRLNQDIEKLEPLTRLAKARTCTLTLSSNLQLESSLLQIIGNLDAALQTSTPDLAEVSQIQSTLRYLETYVEVEVVQVNVRKSKALLRGFMQRTMEKIEATFAKGLDPTSVLAPCDVELIKECLAQACEVDKSFSVDHYFEGKVCNMRSLKGEVLKSAKTRVVFRHAFSNIRLLSGFGKWFRQIYDETCQELAAMLNKASSVVSQTDISNLVAHNVETTVDFVDSLAALLFFSEALDELEGVDFSSLLHCKDRVLENLSASLKSWIEMAERIDPQTLKAAYKDLVACVEVCEILHRHEHPILEGLVVECRGTLQKFITSSFCSACDNLETQYPNPHIRDDLSWMKDAVENLSRQIGYEDAAASLRSAVDKIEVHLRHKAGELETMAAFTKDNGFTNGCSLGAEVSNFCELAWFDEYLSADAQFVSNCATAIEFVISSRIKEKQERLNDLAKTLRAKDFDLVISLVPELKEIDDYQDARSLRDQDHEVNQSLRSLCCDKLNQYVDGVAAEVSKNSKKWNNAISNGTHDVIPLLSGHFNTAYRDASRMKLIPLNQMEARSKTLVEKIVSACGRYSDHVEVILKRLKSFDVDFVELAAILKCLKSVAREDINDTRHLLPEFLEVQRIVTGAILEQAHLIEQDIEASSDWKAIDSSVELFSSASILDAFVNNEVSNRLSVLRRLRNQKESNVNDHLREMIDGDNYSGLSDFLSPLAGSNDQLQLKKFESFREDIVFKLKVNMTTIKSFLDQQVDEESVKRIARTLNILETAKRNLQALLRPKLNLESELRCLKSSIEALLRQQIRNMHNCLDKKDLFGAASYCVPVSLISDHLGSHISKKISSMVGQVKARNEKELIGVDQHIRAFFETRSDEGRSLTKLLASLKCAADEASGNSGKFPHLSSLYKKARAELRNQADQAISTIRESIEKSDCYDDVTPILLALNRQMNGPLREHFPANLLADSDSLLQRLQRDRKEQDKLLQFGNRDNKATLQTWNKKLCELESPGYWRRFWKSETDRASYRVLLKKIEDIVDRRFTGARKALKSRDFHTVQEAIEFISLVDEVLSKHIKCRPRLDAIYDSVTTAFKEHCKYMNQLLTSRDIRGVEESFLDYKGFLQMPSVLKSSPCKKSFSLVNQLLHECLTEKVDSFRDLLEGDVYCFSEIKSRLLHIRKFAGFFADRVTLLHAQLKERGTDDNWLCKIHAVCSKFFSNGRNFSKMRQCALLNVVPSASKRDINVAFRDLAKQCHPDKRRKGKGKDNEDPGLMFRLVKEAQDELLESDHFDDKSSPFDQEIRKVCDNLRSLAKSLMKQRRYDIAEQLLFELPNLKSLGNLLVPCVESQEITEGVTAVIAGHVDQMRVVIDSAWSERKYKDLNDAIGDLKLMESHFKSHANIFAKSWNTGLVQKVETEIEFLGKRAKECLKSHAVAKKQESDFRRHFLDMGSVLIELPTFKAFTKKIMSECLECCLDSNWGYSFLFEFGLSLQKGEDSQNEDESRIARMIVAEFSHFKEVMTMVWNTETTQKPVEDVVGAIHGRAYSSSSKFDHISIDASELLRCYNLFEKQYKSSLGEYIKPEADVDLLVSRVLADASRLNISCDSTLSSKDKDHISSLLAGVFALFTIIKSGASYNRIEASDGSKSLGDKLLMKPHSIQVLTLLLMFGCGRGDKHCAITSLLMQIRTGEGKSMVLGAASALLGILGFQVRTVCYSDYLSTRDFRLFEECFKRFGLLDRIKYSKITRYAEDCTASKGDLRSLTKDLLRGNLPQSTISPSGEVGSKSLNINSGTRRLTRSSASKLARPRSPREVASCKKQKTSSPDSEEAKGEILLVDEVDVFFGKEFYGQTYNQVVEFKEPEVGVILKRIWTGHTHGHRMRLSEIKAMSEYASLLKKMSSFAFVLDNEIALMLSQVKRVDDVPYVVDARGGRIGYKVLDTISFDVTYGYATIFAYLKEESRLGDVSDALMMPISCGQFSYANICPTRIMGVSGTLEAIGQFEKDVLLKFGLNQFVFVPSVYGDSNFSFDKAGEGISFENNVGNFHHAITSAITQHTRNQGAVIVFFKCRAKLNEFVNSPSYRQLSRHKKLLTEDQSSVDKEFVISKAATTGQITLSTAVFGRGTDFFCKDERVDKSGGVHIIQTFLSPEISEEIQIQGRTARQGKRGSYQMILLDSDLESDFGVDPSLKNKVPKNSLYEWLCKVRVNYHKEQTELINENLTEATQRDRLTHEYFDSLLLHNGDKAAGEFQQLYKLIKTPPMPSEITVDIGLVLDITGSMGPFVKSALSTIRSLFSGRGSLKSSLSRNFPEIDFIIRVGWLAFKDIDDARDQFTEFTNKDGSHFTVHTTDALDSLQRASRNPSGGFDLAEDLVGAVHRAANWSHESDWSADSISFMMLFSDAANHGLVPKGFVSGNADSYPTRHPRGINPSHAVASLVKKGIGLILCSFNPAATADTEAQFIAQFEANQLHNTEDVGLIPIPMIDTRQVVSVGKSCRHGRHIVFVLDQSGSMSHSWSGVVSSYNEYINKRKQSQSDADIVSVVQFDHHAQTSVCMKKLSEAPTSLGYSGGGTSFYPAAQMASNLVSQTPGTHSAVVIFMSDGAAGDASHAAQEFSRLNSQVFKSTNQDLELHVIAFGGGANHQQLQQIAESSRAGKVHSSANTAELEGVFIDIATNSEVSTLLESEIAKRISEAVSDKLSLEYFSG